MRKIAEMAFLKTVLADIMRGEKSNVIIDNMETIITFDLPGAYVLRQVSTKLWNSLFDGLKRAVETYGEKEGTRRISERIIQIIIKNSDIPTTREDIMRSICITDMQASIMSNGHGGFNFTVDEDGNYNRT